MLWGIYSAIYGDVNVSVEKCVEIKGDYFEKQQSCFISVTLKSWSGRKLLDPTAYNPAIRCCTSLRTGISLEWSLNKGTNEHANDSLHVLPRTAGWTSKSVWFDFRREWQYVLFVEMSRPALVMAQSSAHCVTGASFRPACGVDQVSPSSVEVRNEVRYATTHIFMVLRGTRTGLMLPQLTHASKIIWHYLGQRHHTSLV